VFTSVDQAVVDADRAVGVTGHGRIMGDQDNRDAFLLIERSE
jgi:hypothetical protein